MPIRMQARAMLLGSAIRDGYRRLFSVAEIERTPVLQWLFGGLLFFFYITFANWTQNIQISTENKATAICWPYFQNCKDLYFLTNLPFGYSQTTFYTVLLGLLTLTVYVMWKRWWTAAHALMLLFFCWKFFAGYILSYNLFGMYDQYHMILTGVFLFVPYKEYFSKLAFVMMYFVSATVKFYPTWILGVEFTSLQLGIPLFPHALTLPITNLVIFAQVVGCWFLLSRHRLYQRLAVVFFFIFHLYSTVLVTYEYPTINIPTLLILFGPMYRYHRPALSKKAIAGWLAILVIIGFQTPEWFSSQDSKLTIAGDRFGMWMFDANHQCIMTVTVYYKPGVAQQAASSSLPAGTPCSGYECMTSTRTYEENGAWIMQRQFQSPVSFQRCDPYIHLEEAKTYCSSDVSHVAMTFDHSINGSPFYRIIDQQNVCDLTYKLFGPNPWIVTPPQAPAIGYPVKNVYRYPGQG